MDDKNEKKKLLVADVAFPLRVSQFFTYSVPEKLKEKILPGSIIKCPFKSTINYGVVFKIEEREDIKIELKSIDSVLFEEPPFNKEFLNFLEFIREYYLTTIGEVIDSALPFSLFEKIQEKKEEFYSLKMEPPSPLSSKNAMKVIELLKEKGEVQKKEIKNYITTHQINKLLQEGYVSVTKKRVWRDSYVDIEKKPMEKFILTSYQEEAYKKIKNELKNGFRTFFLYGVTGSGKTEVYLRLVEDVRAQGDCAIILVPEISLTPQLSGILKERFGKEIVVFHSGLTDGERFDAWMKCKDGEAKIVVGARSAIWTPLKNVGLIVVDEEHDPSYKQSEKTFRYNGRDVAITRGKFSNCSVILCSATPSLESYGNIKKGKYTFISLPERVEKREMPQIEIVDMRFEKPHPEDKEKIFSKKLLSSIKETLLRNEQVILFLNRRGFSAFLLCRKCGFVLECPNCSISLTYHKSINSMLCHYCDFKTSLPKYCPCCSDTDISLMGYGTEKIENKLKEIFPETKIERLDRDTARGKGLRKILDSFRKKEISILIGTQILTKGHDFPDVTLVGVILAEIGLKFPDFRASERTFHLLTQVAGRAGRGEKKGKVIIQTYDPQHYALKYVVDHNYHGFIEKEDALRYQRGYPPYTYLVLIEITGKNQKKTMELVEKCKRVLLPLIKNEIPKRKITLLGPSLAPYQKLKGKYRWMILLKSKERILLLRYMKKFQSVMKIEKLTDPKILIDVDPVDFL